MMRKLFVVVAVFALIAALLAVSESARSVAARGLLAAAAPFWNAENKAAAVLGEYRLRMQSKEELIRDSAALRERVAELEAKLLSGGLPRADAELLALLRNFGRDAVSGELVVAAVLAKPNRSPYDTLILDAGERAGIRAGSMVYAHGTIAIGVIEAVSGGTSRAKLFSSPGEEIDVLIGGENIAAIARGAGGGNFRLKLPRGVDVAPGDPVSLPALGAEIIGVIEKVKAVPSDPFQTILFKSPVNLFQLRTVLVLVPADTAETGE